MTAAMVFLAATASFWMGYWCCCRFRYRLDHVRRVLRARWVRFVQRMKGA